MRRRRKVTWLPNVGSLTAQPGNVYQGIIGNFAVPANTSSSVLGGPSILRVFPAVQDEPLDEETSQDNPGNLARIVGQEYILERIVGKAFIAGVSDSIGEDTGPKAILVTAGFFVARVDPQNQNFPIGSTEGGVDNIEFSEMYGPQNLRTVREPWIWRRSWMLGTEFDNTQPLTAFPNTTGFYGSVADGPHIDAKSKRRVGNDERLFFALEGRSFSASDERDGTVSFVIDYRVLGRLVRAHNRSSF